jgi:outer membrane immunogenic protein
MSKMKKRLLTGVSLVALATAAVPANAAPPFYSWTGWYAGGNIGYSWGKASSTYNEPALGGVGLPTTISTTESLNGPIGGGQIGYNWQASPLWVFGIESDLQFSGEKGSSGPISLFCVDCEFSGAVSQTHSTDIQWFGTVRGRAGILFNPTLLLYATGGLAYGQIKVSGTLTDTSCIPSNCVWSYGTTTTQVGWVAGFGVEGALPTMPGWSWKAEYLYIDFGTISGSGFDTDFSGPFTWSTSVTDQILRVGVNYHFH